ncbi:uncharacterized protein C2orf81 homolog [Pipra filicauda]|uniref:Uncharacterized protein C2orf81 homolog n=1 Tax=Pipra filicauda TaxID=649802 RepID=A0A6J2GPX3_9PASS|nr:uncharacterized protein C2orf81 homolog [Pipra filicauda]
MAEKKRSSAPKARRDKSRPPARASPRASTHSDTHTPPAEGGRRSPPGEPLDVEDILAELLDRVIAESVRAAVARQRVPYTVSRARDAILCVVEWRFLARDEGDPDPGEDPDPERARAWSEDEEPQPCVLDTSAQGVVPVRLVPPSLGEVPSQESPVTDEASSEHPLRALDAVTVPAVRLSRGEVLDAKPPSQDPPAAAGAPPAVPGRVPGAVPTLPAPGPPRPKPPTAPRSPDRESRPSRPPRPEPPPCDSWLSSALLAPGVTVRWAGGERRGPGTAGHGEHEEEEGEVSEAERELRPILSAPAFRLASDGER